MKTRRLFMCVAAVLLAVSFSGCAGIQRQAFNKDANRDIKKIGIIEQIEQEKYLVENMGHPGMAFGLIGGAIALADITAKRNEFTKLVKDARGFRVVEEFQKMLLTELEGAGYSMKLIKGPRAKHELLEKYEGLDDEVDVYLDFTLAAGYFCASSGSDYIPSINTLVRLVKRDTKEILYQELIYYGYKLQGKEAACIPSEQQYYFKDFEALKGKPDLAIEGVRKGVPLVSSHIAQSLRR